MDALRFNKIAAALLSGVLLIMVFGKIGNLLVNPNTEVSNAYPIEVPENAETKIKETKEIVVEPILALLANADIDSGQKISKKCVACHSFNSGGKNKVGPNLWNILNQSKASKDGYSYSKALKEFGGEWDYQSLNAFLLKPKNYINGTKMNFSGLKKTKDRANIIAWLRSLSDNPEPLPTEDEIKLEADDSSS